MAVSIILDDESPSNNDSSPHYNKIIDLLQNRPQIHLTESLLSYNLTKMKMVLVVIVRTTKVTTVVLDIISNIEDF